MKSNSVVSFSLLKRLGFGILQKGKIIRTSSNLSTTAHKPKSKSTLDLKGIIPPLVTPFNEDQSIAYDKLQFNFDKWNKIPFRGYLIEGTNGEYVNLSHEERIELVKKAREFTTPGKILLGGSGCESTKATIDMTLSMAEAGVDAVVVVTPCYHKNEMKDRNFIYHYEEVAEKSPVPVILYNVPAFTGVELSADVIVHLSQHDNVIGLKESGGDITKIGNILHKTRDQDFQLLAGSAGFLLASLYLGCVGGVCAFANPFGEEVCRLYELFTKGPEHHREAKLLQGKLIPLNTAVTKVFGVAGLKEIMDNQGYYGGPVRSPLMKLSANDSDKLLSLFKSSGFI